MGLGSRDKAKAPPFRGGTGGGQQPRDWVNLFGVVRDKANVYLASDDGNYHAGEMRGLRS
jgi:hypothetical protein